MKSIAMEDSPPTAESRLWQAWLSEHGEWFLLYARQQTRSEADAKDVFQEALFDAWRRASGAIPDKALVLATIRRRAIDLGRSADRRVRRENDFGGARTPWFVTDFDAGDTRDFLATAVRDLPENLREVLILRIWGEMSFPEIASLTGAPVPTATSRYRYALERLRESLAELQP
ncbi:MAG: sigma-70 family RNA polymerase sigma factor [Akkermansiaceae bacterium]|jgi:RNA polymerase sigma-70 factor (ECF subfamily)|nr:sigma-70 family RNA polymerase sigma factor [Akkermansiaceae bacterium]